MNVVLSYIIDLTFKTRKRSRNKVQKARMVVDIAKHAGSCFNPHICDLKSMLIFIYTISENSSDEITFQIAGSSAPGVLSTIESLLGLWTPDGDYIYNQLTVEATVGFDERSIAPNGTEFQFSDEGIGVWIYIKK